MSVRRLWIVSELYYPEETSTGYFITKIAEGLAGRFQTRAICSRPTYNARDVPVPWQERHNGVDIRRMRSTRFDKDFIVGRIANLLTFSVITFFFCLFRLRRGDRVLVVTNPPTIPPLVGIVAGLKGARAFLLVHDVYPEVLIGTGLISARGIAARVLGKLISGTYALYERIIVLGRDMAAVARHRMAGNAGRIAIITNWGDVDEVTPLDPEDNPFSRIHNPDARTVIQYSGNIGRTHDVESVVDAARVLSTRNDILFQFIGGGGKAKLLGEATRNEGNIQHLPRQPREVLGPMLASADAVVIPFVDRMLGVSVPSRMYNVMAAGTPIIAMAHPESELAKVVMEEECGWVLPAGDKEALISVIEQIATPEGRLEAARRGQRGREAAIRRFSLPIVIQQFAELLGEPRE